MKITEVIRLLEKTLEEHGDLHVVDSSDVLVDNVQIVPDSFDPETDEKVNMARLT